MQNLCAEQIDFPIALYLNSPQPLQLDLLQKPFAGTVKIFFGIRNPDEIIQLKFHILFVVFQYMVRIVHML